MTSSRDKDYILQDNTLGVVLQNNYNCFFVYPNYFNANIAKRRAFSAISARSKTHG